MVWAKAQRNGDKIIFGLSNESTEVQISIIELEGKRVVNQSGNVRCRIKHSI